MISDVSKETGVSVLLILVQHWRCVSCLTKSVIFSGHFIFLLLTLTPHVLPLTGPYPQRRQHCWLQV